LTCIIEEVKGRQTGNSENDGSILFIALRHRAGAPCFPASGALAINHMLCDSCKKRQATIHNTLIFEDIIKKSDLCEECFQASRPDEAGSLAAALKGGCRYCGGEPFTGSRSGTAQTAMGTGLMARTLSFMCKPCAEEYFRFLSAKIPYFNSDNLTKEQAAELAKRDFTAIFAEVDAHMKKWLSERNL
jgi:hypothetical protein